VFGGSASYIGVENGHLVSVAVGSVAALKDSREDVRKRNDVPRDQQDVGASVQSTRAHKCIGGNFQGAADSGQAEGTIAAE